jgi:predicted HTH transcriptional regulator
VKKPLFVMLSQPFHDEKRTAQFRDAAPLVPPQSLDLYLTHAAQGEPAKLVLRPRQEQLLQLLRDHKSMSPSQIWAALGVSRQGAMDLLKPLIKAGLVKRIGTKKTGQYILA